MTEEKWMQDVERFSHVALVVTVSAFSAVLIALNRMLGWELWTIPVVVVGVIISIVMHVGRLSSERSRLAVFATILLLELFYYSVKAETVYDSTPVVAIVLILFAMTGYKSLIYTGMGIGCLGMVFHLVEVARTGGLHLGAVSVMRTVGHFALVLAAGVATLRLLDAWGRMETAYRRKLDEITEENKRINTFLINVSHEVRTPVNAVVGLSAVLLKRARDEEIRRDLNAIRDAGRRVAKQVGDILDFTEIDMGRLTVSNERYLIASLVNDVLAEYPSSALGNRELIVNVETTVPAELVGDGEKLKKILHHLIDNAFKFSPEGGVFVHIHSGKRPYGVNLCIEVTDTGIGMTKEELEHIYESFYQSDSGRSRTAGGLGLGLTVVRGMVRAMKGFITINSARGEGTTVTVSVPQEVADATDCVYVDRRSQVCIAGFFHFEKYDTPRVRDFYSALIADTTRGLGVSVYLVKDTEELELLRQTYGLTHIFVGEEEYAGAADYLEPLAKTIDVVVVAKEPFRAQPGSAIRVLYKPVSCFAVAALLSNGSEPEGVWDESGQLLTPGLEALVVDDEPMNLTVADGLLGGYGMKVTKARSGAEAIELCKERRFDIIFMDHMMPEMDGVEAMKIIRADAAKRDWELIIVALTANAVSGAREMFLSEGFDGFVAKPIEITELERVLKRVLPRSALTFVQPGGRDASEDGAAGAKRAAAAETELFDRLARGDVNAQQGLAYCRNDRSFYRMLLGEYQKNTGASIEKLRGFFGEKDWKNYAVVVHALKSTSKMIGAEPLSELAARLETAAKKKDAAVIEQRHGELLRAAETVLRAVREAIGASEQEPEEEILEFVPREEAEEEILEFAPREEAEEEILEFAPKEGGREREEDEK
ncbi:MAG: response regulator [Oscillospiraceae bacterium]|nr:response regulator [Oscillospiraceae bacterium]